MTRAELAEVDADADAEVEEVAGRLALPPLAEGGVHTAAEYELLDEWEWRGLGLAAAVLADAEALLLLPENAVVAPSEARDAEA